MQEATKRCCLCKNAKPKSEFGKDSSTKDKLTHACKPCRNARGKSLAIKNGYYKTRNDKHRQYRKEYYAREDVKRRHRNASLIKSFGIGINEYDSMFAKQNGVCGICNQCQKSSRNKSLAVDHCHVTKRIRGLLCDRCNRAIGLLGDDPNLLRKAIDYLKHHSGDAHEQVPNTQ